MKKVSRFVMAALAVSIAAALGVGPANGSGGIEQTIQSVVSLDPGVKDTLDVIDTRSCTELGIFYDFAATDTVRYYLDYSVDKTTFTLIDSTSVNCGAAGASVFRQLYHAAGTTSHFESFIYPWMRIRFYNRAVVDTSDATFRLICGRK